MYNEVVASFSREAGVAAADPAAAPILQDLFKGQPAHAYWAGAALFCEGDEAGHIFNVVEGIFASTGSCLMAAAQ